MKGLILAGGTGSRLMPLTKVTNKHLLPIGKYPMIYHSLFKLKEANVTDIMVVTGKEHMGDVVNFIGSGTDFGVSITYRVQDQAGGIAQALGLAEGFVGSDDVVVILGDNIFEDSLVDHVQSFDGGCKIMLSQVDDPHRFGVAELNGDRIVTIIEKPKNPPSNLAVTGVYFYDSSVFNIVKTLNPSDRNELEITDVNNAYLKLGLLKSGEIKGWWSDAGTHESFYRANELAKGVTLKWN